MTEPMQALFLYAQENMLGPLLRQQPEYPHIYHDLVKQETALRALLEEDTRPQLEKLLKAQFYLDDLNERAIFQAGFRLARDLMGT